MTYTIIIVSGAQHNDWMFTHVWKMITTMSPAKHLSPCLVMEFFLVVRTFKIYPLLLFLFLFLFCFLVVPWHIEFPDQGSDPSCSCNLCHCWILHPLGWARDRTCIPALQRHCQSHCATAGTPRSTLLATFKYAILCD